jgi:hypothetical protein
MGIAPGLSFDADVLRFDVAPGSLLVGIDLLALDASASVGQGVFVAIAAGASIAPFDPSAHLGDALIAAPGALLPVLAAGTLYGAPGFAPPLGAGTYTFWIQETSALVDYSLAFTIVPEPGSLSLVALGLASLLARTRRSLP